jgi:hypothetical protein
MIVCLIRPTPADGPWLLFSQDCREVDLIDPPLKLQLLMPEQYGWFEAERRDDRWTIGSRVEGPDLRRGTERNAVRH